MLPDEACVGEDAYGCPTILVRSKHLKNFPGLIAWIRQKGYGRDRGLLKLRLHEEDRQDEICVRVIMAMMKEKMKEKMMDEESKKIFFTHKPNAQTLYRAAVHDHIYQFVDAGCTAAERKQFVKEATNPCSYKEKANCCTERLESGGLNGIRQHLFEVVQQSSSCLDSIKERMNETNQSAGNASPIIYGAGIPVNPERSINICEEFSMTALDDVLNQLEDKMDGIAYPYIYSGALHSAFQWHIEDEGLYSINYMFEGAKKLWFGIASQHFGLVDEIADSLRLSRNHASCRALLVNHKVLVADPEYFKQHHGVPYITVLQEPGDLIITFPYAVHSGFNLGTNLAIAANFADVEWIEWGIYAPLCNCNPDQVQFDFTNILIKYRPDLLERYLNGTSLLFPNGHPREVRRLVLVTPNEQERTRPSKSQDCMVPRRLKRATGSIKSRTLYCPGCNQSFKENKMTRLKNHIKIHHTEKFEYLNRIVDSKYPPWTPKMKNGLTCNVCSEFIRGDKCNLRMHLQKKHPDFCYDLNEEM